ncbi:MAG: hypothetical protein EB084_20750 [Proteobacteria bacterium]|nr:hypothetical protein [Pseudomonadota bacterium]
MNFTRLLSIFSHRASAAPDASLPCNADDSAPDQPDPFAPSPPRGTAHVVEINRTDVHVITRSTRSIGELMHVDLDTGDRLVSVPVRVGRVWEAGGLFHVGGTFEKLDASQMAAVRACIAARAACRRGWVA